MGEGETPSHCLLFVFLYDYLYIHDRIVRWFTPLSAAAPSLHFRAASWRFGWSA